MSDLNTEYIRIRSTKFCFSDVVIPLPLESKDNQRSKMNFLICYKLIIAPLANLFEGTKIINAPADRAFYNI